MALTRAGALAFTLAALLPPTGRAQTPSPQPHAAIEVNAASPHVWIFCGTPGDQEHHDAYEKLLARIREALTKRYEVSPDNMVVLYGPADAGYTGECTREALMAQLAKVTAYTQTPGAAPAWLIFLGHANAIAGGAYLNLPGADVSSNEIGEALRGASQKTPMVIVLTTACSSAFMGPLAGENRILISATSRADKENETEFPNALADALEAPQTDSNHDGVVTATELFLACHQGVLAIFKKTDLMLTEHTVLDGTGHGHGSQRPAAPDAEGGSRVGLRLATTGQHKYD